MIEAHDTEQRMSGLDGMTHPHDAVSGWAHAWPESAVVIFLSGA